MCSRSRKYTTITAAMKAHSSLLLKVGLTGFVDEFGNLMHRLMDG